MTQEEFIKLLEQKRIDFDITGSGITVTHGDTVNLRVTNLPKGIKFENDGGVYLHRLTELREGIEFKNRGGVFLDILAELPKGIKFNNDGGVYMDSLTELPEDTKFGNVGGVHMRNLTDLPKAIEFKNVGSVYLDSLSELAEDIKFENGGGVYLYSLTELREGTEFKNRRDVYLDSLTELPEGVKFANGGCVFLNRLTELPNGTEFKNGGGVYMENLTELPEDIKFGNDGTVCLPNLKGNQPYLGKEREFRSVDGFTTIICETKEYNGYQIHSARYLGGGNIEDLKRCYIAEGEGFTAHGATINEALEDLRYKVTEHQDKTSVAADVMSSGRVTLDQFRDLTGACREGIRNHLAGRGIDLGTIDDMALSEALGLMEGTSFGEEFKRYMEEVA